MALEKEIETYNRELPSLLAEQGNLIGGEEDELSGDIIYPWWAFVSESRFPRPDAGYGNTELDAIADLAIKKGWKLWNEETMIFLNEDERYEYQERLGILCGDQQPNEEAIKIAEQQIIDRRNKNEKTKGKKP
jgi:hypothetical protein